MKRLLAAALLAGTLPCAALAGSPAEDYVAARNAAITDLLAAEKAGKSEEALDALDQKAREALKPRMAALLGPLRFKGYDQNPLFSPGMLLPGTIDSGSPDGLVFASTDGNTDILVSPEPVFADWLKARAEEEGAPEAFKKGFPAATEQDEFYTAVFGQDAAFMRFADLPVTGKPGEELRAAVGIFTQDLAAGGAPDTLVLARVADGRIYFANIHGAIEGTSIPECDKIWSAAEAKSQALQQAAEKANKDGDPLWEEANAVLTKGSDDMRACFASKAKDQPFFAALIKQAEALADTTRGN